MEIIKEIKNNFVEVFSNWKYSLLGLIALFVMGFPFYYFTNLELLQGNFGNLYMWTQIILQSIITILFAIFLPVSVYKYVKFSSFSLKENTTSGFGAFIGVLVAGCPACSITLASYLGLAGLISYLPWYGLELKIIAVPLLLYANTVLLKNMNKCKLKIKKK